MLKKTALVAKNGLPMRLFMVGVKYAQYNRYPAASS